MALKADNPRLMLSPSTNRLEGFANPLLFSIAGQEGPVSGPNGTVERGAENIEIVRITDARRHRAATDATRAVALAATKSRESKESEEVKKRGAPKL
ncbi:MAG TPA: hypothetical protein VH436_21805 [Vicinamibacterales bacterium]|jgi:hypothetical protein